MPDTHNNYDDSDIMSTYSVYFGTNVNYVSTSWDIFTNI